MNFRRLAEKRRDDVAAQLNIPTEHAGGILLGKGAVGNARLAEKPEAFAAGVIGNVIHIEPKHAMSKTALFSLSGVTLVGRRINDPLRRSSASRKMNLARARIYNCKLSQALKADEKKEDAEKKQEEE